MVLGSEGSWWLNLPSENGGIGWVVLLDSHDSACESNDSHDSATRLDKVIITLGGGFKYFFYVHPHLGKWANLTNIFFNGVVQPPPRYTNSMDGMG